MALDSRQKIKLRNRIYSPPQCPVCQKSCYVSDADGLEYIKTKRGTEIFIHTDCMKGGVNDNGII